MDKILMPLKGSPERWKTYLSRIDPHLHRRSATIEYLENCIAVNDLTADVTTLLSSHFLSPQTGLIVPGRKVALNENGIDRAPSDNDIWALIKYSEGLISLVIEVKTQTQRWQGLKSWINVGKTRKTREDRLDSMTSSLGLISIRDSLESNEFPYQLFHRTYSALKEADRFGANSAVVIVYSLNQKDKYKERLWKGLQNFLTLFNVELVEKDTLVRAILPCPNKFHEIKLYFALLEA